MLSWSGFTLEFKEGRDESGYLSPIVAGSMAIVCSIWRAPIVVESYDVVCARVEDVRGGVLMLRSIIYTADAHSTRWELMAGFYMELEEDAASLTGGRERESRLDGKKR